MRPSDVMEVEQYTGGQRIYVVVSGLLTLTFQDSRSPSLGFPRPGRQCVLYSMYYGIKVRLW